MRRWLCLALCVAHGAADEHAEGLRDCIKQVLSSFKAIDTDGNGELSKASSHPGRKIKANSPTRNVAAIIVVEGGAGCPCCFVTHAASGAAATAAA